MENLTLSEFLSLLAAGPLSAAVLSILSERLQPFQTLSSGLKKAIQLIGTVALSVGAYAVIQFVPAETIQMLAPWFAVIVASVFAWWTNQKTHEVDKELKGE